VEAGVIISQETPAGTRVKKGGFVYVTVSKGPDLSVTLTLPDLLNMTKAEVEAWAKANHMTKVRITTEFSDTVPAGKVIRYEINDNTVVGNEVRRDTPVYVIVSKGIDTTVEQIEVPDFKTMTLADCYAFANDNGLVLSVTEQYDDYIPEGSIISSSVKEKEKVPRGTEIRLVASKGKKIEIPDFSDYTRETALSVASGLGIPVTVIEKYSGSAEGAFISQSIPAGTVYEKGDFLELYYSLGNKIVVPSFVGQTRDAIESWALDLNSKGARISISATTTNSSQPAGTIIYQTPANTTVGVKKTISITVSKGQVVYVPDFISGASLGYDVAITREQAIARCEELKLVPVFKAEAKSGVLPGAIWYQDLAPGKEVTEGTKIVLKYSPAPAELLEVPKFTGRTEDQIKADPQENYLKQFNLVFVPAEANDGIHGENVVIRQSVPVGTKVPYGTMITLYTNPPL
jgi:beta-lactam-binding protein with PASTA domain